MLLTSGPDAERGAPPTWSCQHSRLYLCPALHSPCSWCLACDQSQSESEQREEKERIAKEKARRLEEQERDQKEAEAVAAKKTRELDAVFRTDAANLLSLVRCPLTSFCLAVAMSGRFSSSPVARCRIRLKHVSFRLVPAPLSCAIWRPRT